MLAETQVVRSKSELVNEIQRMPIAKAVIYRNVNRKAWEVIGRSIRARGLLWHFST